MAKVEFDKKLDSKRMHKPILKKGGNRKSVDRKKIISKHIMESEKGLSISGWNFIYAFLMFFVIFGVLIFNIAKLQIIEGEEMLERSLKNKVRITSIKTYRGVIFDSNGQKLVENTPSSDVYISIDKFYKEDGLDNEGLSEVLNTLEGILKDNWKSDEPDGTSYTSISDRVFSIYNKNPYISKILLAKDLDNDTLIKIKSFGDELKGISIDDGSKRSYVYKDIYSHILGYTGEVSQQDLDKFNTLSNGDIVGKSGVERYYEAKLHGKDGRIAEEVDVFGRSISDQPYTLSQPVSGYSLYLTISTDLQRNFMTLYKTQ